VFEESFVVEELEPFTPFEETEEGVTATVFFSEKTSQLC
jgi:hypothetical protein